MSTIRPRSSSSITNRCTAGVGVTRGRSFSSTARFSDPENTGLASVWPSSGDDDKSSAALNEVAREEGLLLCPEGAATYAAYKDSLADGRVAKGDRVMLFNCATGLKYPLPPVTRTLDRHKPIDYSQF